MSNPYLIAARGAGRSFPVFPRTVSIYSNNYRKLHGLPMMRHVHLMKIEKKKFNKLVEEWIKLMSGHVHVDEDRKWFGIDLAKGEDFSTCIEKEIMGRQLCGQKLINQNAVVKIVTSVEE